jgi:uncharacterized protein (TIGR00730 family)
MGLQEDFQAAVQQIESSYASATRSPAERRFFQRLLKASADLYDGDGSSLDVKIASTALEEMTRAFDMFAPYRDIRKVSIFGSARTTPENPIYSLTVNTAKELADAGFMVVTGAGPGIMEAGMKGAGRERSIGVSIRLPFETGANSIIAGDEKYVSMRYFFTRKLMLVKESHAFLCLPGGFGTLDETFELLTLAQTAKSVPVPIVFLEVPGDPFWTPLMATMEPLLLAHGLISPTDTSLYKITDNIQEAVEEVVGFYRNYHSIRFVDNRLYLRMQRALPAADVLALSQQFSHISDGQTFEQSGPTPEEVKDNDNLNLSRVSFNYTAKGFADLRPLIDAINAY